MYANENLGLTILHLPLADSHSGLVAETIKGFSDSAMLNTVGGTQTGVE